MARIADHLRMNEAEIDTLMCSEANLRIATIGPGSDINLTPMTFGWAGGRAYVFSRGQKVVNVRRDSTATILVDVGGRWKKLKGVMMRGTAEVLEDEAAESADPHLEDARMNIGTKHGLKFDDGSTRPHPASASGRTRRWIVFSPVHIVSWDNARL